MAQQEKEGGKAVWLAASVTSQDQHCSGPWEQPSAHQLAETSGHSSAFSVLQGKPGAHWSYRESVRGISRPTIWSTFSMSGNEGCILSRLTVLFFFNPKLQKQQKKCRVKNKSTQAMVLLFQLKVILIT